MTANEEFQAGRLQAAIDAQTQAVKAKPADQGARLFLFELLYFAGDLERARKQLQVLHFDDPGLAASLKLYADALDAEAARRDALAGRGRPKSLVPAPTHIDLRLAAIQKLAVGDAAAAADLLAQANDQLPVINGTLNGQPFTGLRDADELFGTVLEVFGVGGNYCWVPLEQVESLDMNEPRTPRDVLLIPAQLAVRDGPAGDVFLPALYPNSHASPDDALRLGRATDWLGGEAEPLRGLGGKLFLMGEEGDRTVSLLAWRSLDLG